MAAVVEARHPVSAWGLPVTEVFFFEPMTARDVTAIGWPWPHDEISGWSPTDWLPPGELPMDPYEW
jgi:hypothetical protein